MANDRPVQIWKFTTSQILLLQEQARLHAQEHEPLNAYQSRAQNDLLVGFKAEFKIPDDVLLSVDLDTMQFTERRLAENVVPFPVEVPNETPLTSADNPDAE